MVRTRFTVGVKIHGDMIDGSPVLRETSVTVHAETVAQAIAKADEWTNKEHPNVAVTFSCYRNPRPEGGYDF